MAAKKRKTRKPRSKVEERPEAVVGAVRAGGRLEIDTEELEQFLKRLKKKSPRVQFVARNAPFMRPLPIAPV